MSKKNNRDELILLGNFAIYGVKDAFGHQTMMEICSVSKNWMMRFDESTFMFGLVKSIVNMPPEKVETKRWITYLHSLINIEYQFGTSGVAVDILVEIGKMLISYSDNQAKKYDHTSDEEEKEIIEDMKREHEMIDELKNEKK